MIEIDWILIRIVAVLAGIMLPIISAISIVRKDGKHVIRRYLGCVGAYVMAIALVEIGYLLQGWVTDAVTIRNFYSGWRWIRGVFTQYEYFTGWDERVLIGIIIAFAVLFARDARARVVTGFRTAFVTYTSFDILNGISAGYTVERYIVCVVFNFIGSFLFGALYALVVNLVLPLRAVRLHEANGSSTSAISGAISL